MMNINMNVIYSVNDNEENNYKGYCVCFKHAVQLANNGIDIETQVISDEDIRNNYKPYGFYDCKPCREI